MVSLPLPRHWYKLPTAELRAMHLELMARDVPGDWEQADLLSDAIDAIREELTDRPLVA
jgi:hypothetical protein